MTTVTSKRPYLIRAMHEWMTDNSLTPYVVVAADTEGLSVPEGRASDGKIILNVSYAATRNFALADDRMSFETRFGGIAERVDVPLSAVIGIYAKESGQGMIFSDDEATPAESGEPSSSTPSERPTLKIVK